MNVHFKSEKMDWETPQDLFDELDQEFGFEVDVCATEDNSKCAVFIDEQADGLGAIWHQIEVIGQIPSVFWMNPPYGREIGKWMKKAYEESQHGCTVVCLVPARTDTAWWHDYAMKADEIRYLRGRLKFVGAKHSAPFPSAIVIFGKPTKQKLEDISKEMETLKNRELELKILEEYRILITNLQNGYYSLELISFYTDREIFSIETETLKEAIYKASEWMKENPFEYE